LFWGESIMPSNLLLWSLTLRSDSKYSGGLLKALSAASWKGAGAQSVTLAWIFLIADARKVGAIAHPTLQPDDTWQINSELVFCKNDDKAKIFHRSLVHAALTCLPVTLNDLDKEDVIIVRSCIPGNETSDICFTLSYVMCSYTYIKNPKEGKRYIIYRNALLFHIFMLHHAKSWNWTSIRTK